MECESAESASALKLRDGKTEALAQIIRAHHAGSLGRILVVGCGAGLEAAILARSLEASVIGIDPITTFDPAYTSLVDLREGDATALEFPNNSFDLVYSFHALEHIAQYQVALREMSRVLAPDGSYCIGTPNRRRVFGYLGSKTASTAEKIRWNLKDWRDRLSGKFTNEAGAHAGFLGEELHAELLRHFGSAQSIALEYYLATHPNRAGTIELLARTGLARYAFPALYFFGRA